MSFAIFSHRRDFLVTACHGIICTYCLPGFSLGLGCVETKNRFNWKKVRINEQPLTSTHSTTHTKLIITLNLLYSNVNKVWNHGYILRQKCLVVLLVKKFPLKNYSNAPKNCQKKLKSNQPKLISKDVISGFSLTGNF